MKLLSLVLVFILSISYGYCGSLRWIIAEKVDDKMRFPTAQIVKQFDVRALFTHFAIIVGTPSDAEMLESLGFEPDYMSIYDDSDRLTAIEFSPELTPKVRELFSKTKQMKKSLIYLANGLAIVKSSIKLISDESFDWEAQTESLPLSIERILPGISFEQSPLYKHLQKIEKNDIISNTLQKVSPDTLYDFDYHLSQNYFTRLSGSDEIFQVRDWLKSTLASYGLKVTTQSYYPDYADNVCGDIVGSQDPEEVVIAGAHYDSRSTSSSDPKLRAPGADDNGSGSSAMLEMSRVLSQSNVTFAKTVRFCFWTGEEQGLFGSNAYSRKMKAENVKVLAYFNADMLGYKPSNKVITLGMKDSSVTEWLLDLSFEITATYVPELPVKLSSSCCSDYISFFNQGYPSIGYFENGGKASDYPNYHKSTDVIANVNFEQLTLETRAILAAVMTFAVPL